MPGSKIEYISIDKLSLLDNNPRKINENPYDAWIVSIAPEGEIGTTDFYDQEADIEGWIEEEMKKYEEEQQS